MVDVRSWAWEDWMMVGVISFIFIIAGIAIYHLVFDSHKPTQDDIDLANYHRKYCTNHPYSTTTLIHSGNSLIPMTTWNDDWKCPN